MKKHLFAYLLFFAFMISVTNAQSQVLWGLAYFGGTHNAGVIFNYNVSGNVYTVLHNFGGGTDGENPRGTLIKASDGLLYGMTAYGGTNNNTGNFTGDGTIFSYNMSTNEYKVLYNFGSIPNDGFIPYGSLYQAGNGLLYGMTVAGPGNGSAGTIFSYDPVTSHYVILHTFGSGADGNSPYGSLIQASDSLLYGLASQGGTYSEDQGAGVMFSYNINTATYTILHQFGAAGDESLPVGSLFQAANGLLYGVASATYPSSQDAHDDGIIFSYDIANSDYTVLHRFGGGNDGGRPVGSFIQLNNGLLYATTSRGGSQNEPDIGDGTIISYDISTGNETVLHNFGAGSDGVEPYGDLRQAGNGLLYGMTAEGNNVGSTIFSYDIASGMETVVHDFGSGMLGTGPFGDLLIINDSATTRPIESVNYVTPYPNPSSGQFALRVPDSTINYQAEVYDLNGVKVDAAVLTAAQSTLDLNSHPPGMYYVYLKSESGTAVSKVMVIK